jgi:hypothetical protein
VKVRWQFREGKMEYGKLVRYLEWRCPGCDDFHMVPVAGNVGNNPPWSLTMSEEGLPTLAPSVLVYDVEVVDGKAVHRTKCHGHLTKGRYTFCSDSKHALKGQTVDLPEFEP